MIILQLKSKDDYILIGVISRAFDHVSESKVMGVLIL